MGYISKFDTKFITYLNRKYKNDKVAFNKIDDYIMWLYYAKCKSDKEEYYSCLEDDIIEYAKWQEVER